ncbi:C-C chemokine receptor type 9-like [Etheostoma cragini]|uniref:C-C chemokine receptor type 9-like n=1 Tax=Etheostoma cragini TaxID=417921 RepID=UPI00155EBAC3|nr:C-C chemokine receptor type 9-like [Etheostoma cragini]
MLIIILDPGLQVNLFSGALLLTCISADRYVVIVRSARAHNSQAARRRCSRAALGGVWLLALLLAAPELVFATVPDTDSFCRMVFPPHIGTRTKVLVRALQVMFGFCVPFVVMAFCYSAIAATLLKTRSFQKHRALCVILAVVAAFVVTQLPYNAVLAVQAAQAANGTMACAEMKRFDTAGQVLKSLAYLHACLNPFLYAFIGRRFRRDVLQLLGVCRPRRRHAPANQSKSCRSSTRATVMSDSDTSQVLSL